MAFQMFVLFLGGGEKAFMFLYVNVIRTMAVISNCVAVIKEPIRAVSLGGSFGKASKTGARTVAPTAKWILNAVCAALILSTIRIRASSTLYKNPGKKLCHIKQQITHYDRFFFIRNYCNNTGDDDNGCNDSYYKNLKLRAKE